VTISHYVDENVPLAITKGLRRRGIDILTVQEDERRGFPDPILLDRAMVLGRVMFSQDEDFPIEAARRQAEGIDFAGVIYARQTAVSVGDCVRDLELIAKVAEPEDFFNQIQYLPL
jgi:predicted nuclease of predicted toxin-antitoxin system